MRRFDMETFSKHVYAEVSIALPISEHATWPEMMRSVLLFLGKQGLEEALLEILCVSRVLGSGWNTRCPVRAVCHSASFRFASVLRAVG